MEIPGLVLPNSGAALQRAMAMKGAADDNALADARMTHLKVQDDAAKEKAAAERAKRVALANLAKNPTPDATVALMAEYPELADGLKQVYGSLDAERQRTRVGQAQGIYAAILSGRNDIAEEMLGEQIEAYKASGMQADTRMAEHMLGVVKAKPGEAASAAALFLAQAMGPEKFADTFGKLQSDRRETAMAPAAQAKAAADASKAQSDAASAAVAARFAESNAVKDLEKKGWDIKKIQEDIKIAKLNSQIAAGQLSVSKFNAETSRKQLGISEQELGIRKTEAEGRLAELTRKRDEEVRTRTSDIESARSSIDNFLNTADRALAIPFDTRKSAHGPIAGSDWGQKMTFSEDTANYQELVKTLGSQAFLAQVPSMKGMGQLSDAEGRKLEAALQSLSLRQSPAQMEENLKEAQRIMLKARKNLSTKFGMPDNTPDTPAAGGDSAEVDALIKKYSAPAQKPQRPLGR